MDRRRKSKWTIAMRRLGRRASAACLALLCAEWSTADEPSAEVRRSVVYATVDDEELTADIYLPDGEGPYPGMLMVHGGAWLAGGKGRMRHIATTLAERGYVAVSINYRLAPKHKFPAQLDDCRAAICWMRDNAAAYKIDPMRIGGFGYSAGAHLVMLMSLTAAQVCDADTTPPAERMAWENCRLKAVVAGGTPCDFRAMPADNRYLAFWLGGTRREKEELYRQASPMAFVTPAAPPVFFYHGEKDLLVLPHGPKALKQALDDVGVSTQLVMVADEGHIGTFMDADALSAAFTFLDSHLQSKTAAAPRQRTCDTASGTR